MTRVRTQIRVPPRRYHADKVSKTERFWTEYIAARAENGVFLAPNTERFWMQYVQQPRRERATSMPPAIRLRGRDQKPMSFLRKLKSGYHRMLDASSKRLGQGVAKLRHVKAASRLFLIATSKRLGQGAARLRHMQPRNVKLVVAAVAGGALLVCLSVNYNRAVHNAALPSPVLDRYYKFPTWMHTDPVQVLGLPASVSPNLVPNMNEVQRAWKSFNLAWRPQFYETHGFDSFAQAQHAYQRGVNAYNAIVLYTESPWCDLNRQPLEALQQDNATYTDGLPQFASPCQCTYGFYLLQQVQRPFIPASYAIPPQSEADIARFCPCNKAMANASWATFTPAAQPPTLRRIQDTVSWWTLDPRVWRFKNEHSSDWLYTNFAVRIENLKACLKGEYEGCEKMPGWGSLQDLSKWASPSKCHTPQDTHFVFSTVRQLEMQEEAQWERENGVVENMPEWEKEEKEERWENLKARMEQYRKEAKRTPNSEDDNNKEDIQAQMEESNKIAKRTLNSEDDNSKEDDEARIERFREELKHLPGWEDDDDE